MQHRCRQRSSQIRLYVFLSSDWLKIDLNYSRFDLISEGLILSHIDAIECCERFIKTQTSKEISFSELRVNYNAQT